MRAVVQSERHLFSYLVARAYLQKLRALNALMPFNIGFESEQPFESVLDRPEGEAVRDVDAPYAPRSRSAFSIGGRGVGVTHLHVRGGPHVEGLESEPDLRIEIERPVRRHGDVAQAQAAAEGHPGQRA